MMMEYLIVDRLEEEYIVCENENTGAMININKKILNFNVKQGDYLYFENGEYKLDLEKTNLAHADVKKIVNNLFKRKEE